MELETIQETIKKILKGSNKPRPALQTTIDYYIIEDRDPGPSKPLEPDARNPLLEAGDPAGQGGYTPIGLDTSSGIIRTPFFNIVIVTGSLSTPRIPELYDHPEVYTYPVKPRIRPPYIILGTDSEAEEEGSGITTRNPLGSPYGYNYSPERIADEYRMWTENWLLSDPLHQALEEEANTRATPVVLVDGPLFQTPQLVSRITGNPEPGGLWHTMISDRISIIRKYEDNGIPVIGIVKRIDQSRLLVSSEAYTRKTLLRCGSKLAGHEPPNDQALVYMLLSTGRCSPEGAARTPIMEYRSHEYGASKLYTYIAIPPNPWSRLVYTYRIYRLEFTHRTLRILGEHSLTPWSVLLGETLRHGVTEPFTVKMSDHRAGMLAQALRQRMRRLVSASHIPFTYDEIHSGV